MTNCGPQGHIHTISNVTFFPIFAPTTRDRERIALMDNPAGYIYTVGRDRGRKSLRRNRPVFYPVDPARLPWVEPSLQSALEGLPDRQREVVVLMHCYEWSMSEVAELLEITKSTVQNHAERGIANLRLAIGAES